MTHSIWVKGFLFLLVSLIANSSLAVGKTTSRVIEGAELRVVIADGEDVGLLAVNNIEGCAGKKCTPLQLALGPDVKVVDRLGGKNTSATYEQLRFWKQFYGRVHFDLSGNQRVIEVIRVDRPQNH